MARVLKTKKLENTRLATNYGGWMYCDKCDENIGYLCYSTYDRLELQYQCHCGSHGSALLDFDDSKTGKNCSDKFIIIKNLCFYIIYSVFNLTHSIWYKFIGIMFTYMLSVSIIFEYSYIILTNFLRNEFGSGLYHISPFELIRKLCWSNLSQVFFYYACWQNIIDIANIK